MQKKTRKAYTNRPIQLPHSIAPPEHPFGTYNLELADCTLQVGRYLNTHELTRLILASNPSTRDITTLSAQDGPS